MNHCLKDARIPFSSDFKTGLLIRRYKRFLADIELDDGSMITAHCPNTGAMKGLVEPSSDHSKRAAGVSYHESATRKYPHTLEMIEDEGGMVGVNTQNPNRLIARALDLKVLPPFAHYDVIESEVYLKNTHDHVVKTDACKKEPRTRIDFCLKKIGEPTCYIEVKNVHYKRGNIAYFPDSVTTRGQRHVRELTDLVQHGHRCVMLYVIQRPDVDGFDFADFIDPDYAQCARDAVKAGVEIMAVTCHLDNQGIYIDRILNANF